MAGILRTVAGVANRQERRSPGFRPQPECIVLAARGALREHAPVRIFVGTEPGQHRAERVFVWSVEQARDPSRTYEIYLMVDLVGFDRRRWLTGFTNYRFAIPYFTGGAGRAIYNDVDQIYLADPAELFDMDMGDRGFLAISARDTSVMLMDCARVAGIWTQQVAQRERRKRIEARAADLWGPLQREWNARDEEYVPGRSKVLHYTTIHTQPWQPFPGRFVYQHNPVGHVWLEMERAADLAGYQVFSAQAPSAEYRELMARLRPPRARLRSLANGTGEGLEPLLAEAGAASVLEYQIGLHAGVVAGRIDAAGRTVTRFDPAAAPSPAPPPKGCDAVVCTAVAEYLPESDVPWLLDALFGAARRCVYLRIDGSSEALRLGDGTLLRARRHAPAWWLAQVEAASARAPEVHWKLVLAPGRNGRRPAALVREGGRRADGRLPAVWVLKDHKAGHTTQSVGLADAIGFPYEVKQLRFNILNHLSNRMRGASTLGLDTQQSAPLGPPWPDLVISTGRRTAPVARWIGQQSAGRARIVQLGRRGGESVAAFDLVVSCAHFRLPLHPRRMEIIAPLNAVTPQRLAAAAERWRGIFARHASPRVVLVVGGGSARYRLGADTARRMGERVRAFAESLGGSLFAITSPRTGAEATAALRMALGEGGHLHEWRAGEADNPYLGYLALADAIVVSGESESMLAEAAATGRALFIYQLPERRLGFRRLTDWVATRAAARPRKAKGTVRPQQGLEYLCARLIEAGIVRPPRRIDQLHQGLIDAGAARYFGAPLDSAAVRPLREVDAVASRVRLLLGFNGVGHSEPAVGTAARHDAAPGLTAGLTPLRQGSHAAAGAGVVRTRSAAQS